MTRILKMIERNDRVFEKKNFSTVAQSCWDFSKLKFALYTPSSQAPILFYASTVKNVIFLCRYFTKCNKT